MTYELALKLKDAGFPQTGNGGYYDPPGWTGRGDSPKPGQERIDSLGEWLTKRVYKPSLSELIEACGERFASLERVSGFHWVADGWNQECTESFSVEGESKKEAVSNLWLVLNTK